MRTQRSQVRVQSETITLCENALRVQEEAVAILPSLLEREREQATAARERAAEAAERLATVHAELDGRKAQEKKLAHEAGLAHKRCALLLDGVEVLRRPLLGQHLHLGPPLGARSAQGSLAALPAQHLWHPLSARAISDQVH